jgi:hypothetical protein
VITPGTVPAGTPEADAIASHRFLSRYFMIAKDLLRKMI